MTGGVDWAVVLDFGVGVGVLLIGIGVFVVCNALAGTLGRVNSTLDEVDRQIAALSVPVGKTLDHVGGIADTADATLARLGGAVGQLETVAGSLAKTSTLTQNALAPTLVNVGATLTGVSAGLRRLVTGRASSNGRTE